ncbi:MAG: cytochrome c [Verrucomicrobia bacterium]|nr:cytochrome c [Verrucomicrobiota bacterium]
MRYFLLFWLLLCVTVVAIAGFRGSTSRKPPIEIFPDMDRQPKLRPQTTFDFFPDNRSSRAQVPGTIAYTKGTKLGEQEVYPFQDHPFNTGRQAGSTNYVETLPVAVTEQLMARGQERYAITCLPCHGASGDGKGITTKFGMTIVANLHDQRIVRQTDGELFDIITHGKGLMGSYGDKIDVNDRWAIVSYVRALQLARLGAPEDVPADLRAKLPGLSAAPAQK